ncbi:cytokinin dehydrogenase 3-like [Senna tora]|uniref:cytokinin dehydrogenase n=1 Tax=Senna tora TaxID=362788 RepID=A0A835CCF3_9FABA|nr:cytokinin dehydrogenase 3-like [Senna tora]
MGENFPFPTYLILTIITIIHLISTVGNTQVVPRPRLLLSDPDISHKLHNDPHTMKLASSDFGNVVHHQSPVAVFRPSSLYDVVSLVRSSYNSPVDAGGFTIAARGQGHSTRGQAMAPNGVVLDMGALRNPTLGHGINVSHDYADVGGGEMWIDVLHATLQRGLAPPSWTDYLYMTVGGTLSNAGIGGQTFRYGPQIANVHQMDVITGKGDLLTCSSQKNSELFHGVLGGLGQFGIIARARIALHPAPKRVKWVRLIYNDFSAFTKDQERLISINGEKKENNYNYNALDYLEGMLLMHQGPINNWRSSFFPLSDHPKIISLLLQHTVLYCLEVAKYYDDHSQHNVDKDVQVLLQGLSYVPGFYYDKNVSFVEFLNRVRSGELKLQSQGLWDVPHPWLNMFIPKSRINDFDSGVFKNIILKRNITTGPVLIYPMNRSKWNDRMSASVPDEEVFYTVGFLHSSGFDDWKAFDEQNKEILRFCEGAGIKVKQYLPHYTTQQDWANHFGTKWSSFQERKYHFDPRMILSPGQRIFNNIIN